jgi:hypothetical protein
MHGSENVKDVFYIVDCIVDSDMCGPTMQKMSLLHFHGNLLTATYISQQYKGDTIAFPWQDWLRERATVLRYSTFHMLFVHDVICRSAFCNFMNYPLILFQFSIVLAVSRAVTRAVGRLASYSRDSCSMPGDALCDLWRIKWRWKGGFSAYLDFPHTSSFHHRSVHIFHSFSSDSV